MQQHIIGGKRVAKSSETLLAHGPATGEVVEEVALGETTDVDAVTAAATEANLDWRWVEDIRLRSCVPYRSADRIEDGWERLALPTKENGKLLSELKVKLNAAVGARPNPE